MHLIANLIHNYFSLSHEEKLGIKTNHTNISHEYSIDCFLKLFISTLYVWNAPLKPWKAITRAHISDTGIRLTHGRTKYMGGVSLFIHDRWETITKVHDEQTAKVVCRILGHNFTRSVLNIISDCVVFKCKLTSNCTYCT